MKYFLSTIVLTRIDWSDTSFAIHSYKPHESLERSLAMVGVLSPPWVFPKDKETYGILNGYKRLNWLRQHGYREACCLVFSGRYQPQELFRIRLEEKLCCGSLNLAEKAQIVARCATLIPASSIYREIFPRLQLPPREHSIKVWCRLVEAGDVVLEALANEWICERAAFILAFWDDESLVEAAKLLATLRCSASIQVEIVERIHELACRGDKSCVDILHHPDIVRIVQHPGLNRREKTAELRKLLFRWCFPRLCKRKKLFQTALKENPLPTGVGIIPPPAFEGNRWKLEIDFEDPEELRGRIEETLVYARSDRLERLYNAAKPEVTPNFWTCYKIHHKNR